MAQRTLRFASGASVHARPAALFSQAAAGSGVPVRIAKGDSSPGDAASILQVVVPGQRRQVTVFTDGPQADGAAVAGPERPTTSTGNASCLARRRPAVDQRLPCASQQCANSLRVSRQESSSMMIPVVFWFSISGTFVAHHVLRAAANTTQCNLWTVPAPSHGHLFHDAEVVLFGPHRPGQHGEFRSRAAAFGRQVGSLSDDPCACRTARRF